MKNRASKRRTTPLKTLKTANSTPSNFAPLYITADCAGNRNDTTSHVRRFISIPIGSPLLCVYPFIRASFFHAHTRNNTSVYHHFSQIFYRCGFQNFDPYPPPPVRFLKTNQRIQTFLQPRTLLLKPRRMKLFDFVKKKKLLFLYCSSSVVNRQC